MARKISPLPPHERCDSLALMRNQDKWPLGNILPVKRRYVGEGGFPECGTLIAPTLLKEFTRIFVFVGTMYEPLHDQVRLEYSSFEAVVDDGWMVD